MRNGGIIAFAVEFRAGTRRRFFLKSYFPFQCSWWYLGRTTCMLYTFFRSSIPLFFAWLFDIREVQSFISRIESKKVHSCVGKQDDKKTIYWGRELFGRNICFWINLLSSPFVWISLENRSHQKAISLEPRGSPLVQILTYKSLSQSGKRIKITRTCSTTSFLLWNTTAEYKTRVLLERKIPLDWNKPFKLSNAIRAILTTRDSRLFRSSGTVVYKGKKSKQTSESEIKQNWFDSISSFPRNSFSNWIHCHGHLTTHPSLTQTPLLLLFLVHTATRKKPAMRGRQLTSAAKEATSQSLTTQFVPQWHTWSTENKFRSSPIALKIDQGALKSFRREGSCFNSVIGSSCWPIDESEHQDRPKIRVPRACRFMYVLPSWRTIYRQLAFLFRGG